MNEAIERLAIYIRGATKWVPGITGRIIDIDGIETDFVYLQERDDGKIVVARIDQTPTAVGVPLASPWTTQLDPPAVVSSKPFAALDPDKHTARIIGWVHPEDAARLSQYHQTLGPIVDKCRLIHQEWRDWDEPRQQQVDVRLPGTGELYSGPDDLDLIAYSAPVAMSTMFYNDETGQLELPGPDQGEEE